MLPRAGLGETVIYKQYSRKKPIEAHLLFVFSTFSTNGLFGNLDFLLPDNEPAVGASETPSMGLPTRQGSTLLLDSRDALYVWLT